MRALLSRCRTHALRLAVVAACAASSGAAVARIAAVALPAPRDPGVPAQGTEPGGWTPPPRGTATVVARNVFCSSCAPTQAERGAGDGMAGSDPSRTALRARLVATLVSEGPGPSYAVLHSEAGASGLYRVGAVVEQAVLVRIEERRIILINAGQAEAMDLMPGASALPVPAFQGTPSHPATALERLAAGIRKLREREYEIQLDALRLALASPHVLARAGRVTPVGGDNGPAGLRLHGVRPGSLYSRLGLFDGDTITAVNGRAFVSVEAALDLLAKLRHATHFSVSFERRGRALTHDYAVR